MDGEITVSVLRKDRFTLTLKKNQVAEHDFAYPDWSAGLAEQMAKDCADYHNLSDPDLRRNKAAAMMGRLLMQIQRLPHVENQVWYPLKDMLHFFSDLDTGVRHSWLTSNVFGGNFKPSAEAELYEWIVVAVEILFDSGYNQHGQKKKAYELVHQSLVQSGRDIKLSTIKAEHYNFKNEWHRGQQRIKRILSQYWFGDLPCPGGEESKARCTHGQIIYQCDTGSGGRCEKIRESAEEHVSGFFGHHSFRDLNR